MKCASFIKLFKLIFSFAKSTSFPDLQRDIYNENLDENDEAFAAEVTNDMIVQTLLDGVADGTLPLSDSDMGNFDDGERL